MLLERYCKLSASFCLIFVATPAMAATWSWSFTTAIADQYAAGQLQSAPGTISPGTLTAILDISGTYHRGGVSYPILGLSGYQGALNAFRWDGSSQSPLITTFDGISFSVLGGEKVNVYCGSQDCPAAPPIGWGAVNASFTTFPGLDGAVIRSRLSPAPGPLPIAGAAAALALGRRLRRRGANPHLEGPSDHRIKDRPAVAAHPAGRAR